MLPLALLAQSPPAALEFNDSFLMHPAHDEHVIPDLSRFAQADNILPGLYTVELQVNGTWAGKAQVMFRDDPQAGVARPCFTQALLERLLVDFSRLSPDAVAALAQGDGQCHRLQDLVPDAAASLDVAELRLSVSVPQVMVLRQPRGYVHPRFWDKGVPAATLSYHANAWQAHSGSHRSSSAYMGMQAALHAGGWHLHHSGAMTGSDVSALRYQPASTYVQTDIVPLKSQLLIGASFTSGYVFDSVGFQGVRLQSDDRMLPDSQVGYAPVIRGVANTQARVRIMQNNILLMETTVAPGHFEIDDLYATGYGGDIVVLIEEADGVRREFTVPYAAFAPLLRPGAVRYSVTAGRTRSADDAASVPFVQAMYGTGVANGLTLYGGVIAAADYKAIAGGVATHLPVGTLSAELTHARARIGERDAAGNSILLRYGRQWQETGTQFSVGAYRYSRSDYLDFTEALGQMRQAREGRHPDRHGARQHQLQMNVHQLLPYDLGTVYMTGSWERYWQDRRTAVQLSAGYSTTIGESSWTLSAQRLHDQASGRSNTHYYLSVSLPLGQDNHAPALRTSLSRSQGSSTVMTTLSGTAGHEHTLGYTISASRSQGAVNGALGLQYRTPYAIVNGSTSRSRHYRQLSAAIAGGVVLHSGGVTLAQELSESIGLVEAHDAAGAQVSQGGVRIDPSGYAVVPYLRPYRLNQVDLDPKGLPLDVELASTSERVSPHAGAVVLIRYPTSRARTLLLAVSRNDGGMLPFGAEVSDQRGNIIGIVSQGGRAMLRGAEAGQGSWLVRWGVAPDQHCVVDYVLPAAPPGQALERLSGVCRMEQGATPGDTAP